MENEADVLYAKEFWTGDSRDGNMVNGEGYHYYRMLKNGKILEAYEFYELEDGSAVVSPLPEMKNVDWINDLGFEDFEVLDLIGADEFEAVRAMLGTPR